MKWNINTNDFLLLVHSGSSAAYLNLYYTPRWGVRGKKFLQFEKQKWDFHRNHIKDKTMSATTASCANIFRNRWKMICIFYWQRS